jgi:hypothetical protein
MKKQAIQQPMTPIPNNATTEEELEGDSASCYKFTVKISSFKVRGPTVSGNEGYIKIAWGRKPIVFKTEGSTNLSWNSSFEFVYTTSVASLQNDMLHVLFFSGKSRDPDS